MLAVVDFAKAYLMVELYFNFEISIERRFGFHIMFLGAQGGYHRGRSIRRLLTAAIMRDRIVRTDRRRSACR